MTRIVTDLTWLEGLVGALRDDGYDVLGPVVRDGVITPGPVRSLRDLPRGVVDDQAPGSYRLRDDGDLLFGFAAAATSWKPYLFPPRRPIWRYDGETPTGDAADKRRRAFLGVRSCDLRAIAVQDAVFTDRRFHDVDYQARRHGAFVVAVTCTTPAATCFCVSMGSGPAPVDGFDLLITELDDATGHRLVVEDGSDAGRSMLARLPASAADHDDDDAVATAVAAAAASMRRRVDTDHIRELLYANADSPRWDDVAARCLACTNCTLVCPTCFCFTTDDVATLTDVVGRDRVWDSCFNVDHSLLHGGPVHRSTRSRYRQWLTHKFASWLDQFGTSGCVGCGRCITWCPVGIDVTEELAAIRATSEESP